MSEPDLNNSLERAVKVIKEIRETGSSNGKVDLLIKNKDIPELREILYYTYHPLKVYGIKSLASSGCYSEPLNPIGKYKPLWPQLKAFLDFCESEFAECRMGSTERATKWSNLMVEVGAQWLNLSISLTEMILSRDLNAGIGVGLINRAFGKDFIKGFEVMRAKKADLKKIRYPVIVEPKYDGVRCVAIRHENQLVTLWSRRGHQLVNYPHIEEALNQINPPFTIEGELVQDDDYQATMSQVRRKTNVDTRGSIFYVFDALPTGSIEAGSHIPQYQRRDLLKGLCGQQKSPYVKVTESYVVQNEDLLMGCYEKFLEDGFEGAMIKKLDGIYVTKKAAEWQKMKPTETLDLQICGFEEGEKGSRLEGQLGALIVKLQVQEGEELKDNEVNVGGGFSDEQRVEFWGNQGGLLGSVIEVEFDRVSKNRAGEYSLRFPRFKCLRPDKELGDILSPEGKIEGS